MNRAARATAASGIWERPRFPTSRRPHQVTAMAEWRLPTEFSKGSVWLTLKGALCSRRTLALLTRRRRPRGAKREREKNKRGSTYSKRKQDPRGRTSPDEDLDQDIKEFAKIDAASAPAAAAKGVQQTVDAAAEDEKNEMSPIHEEQLRDGVLEQAINPEQRELLRLLGTLDQAEARIMRVARMAETQVEQHYRVLNQPVMAEAAMAEEGCAQHVLPVTLEEGNGDDVLIGGYENWQDIDLQMTLDSGCCKHVLPADAAPGYEVTDSPLSMRGAVSRLGMVPGSQMRDRCG